jgi:hypothetical protein
MRKGYTLKWRSNFRGTLSQLAAAIRDWYHGEYVAYENEPDGHVFLIGGYYQRHWTADLANLLVTFWWEHWKFVVGTTLSVIGLVIAYLSL